MSLFASSPTLYGNLTSGSTDWKKNVLHQDLVAKAAELAKDLEEARSSNPEQMDAAMLSALGQESLNRINLYLEGIEKYRASSYIRQAKDFPVQEQIGSTKLIDYAPDRNHGPPILVVPSLVNRAYILDLREESSFMTWLAEQGFHPYMVDWDFPGPEEQSYSLTDYVLRLIEFGSLLRRLHGEEIRLVGYCMGGLLTLAAAQLRPADYNRICLLATPWDFHSDGGRQAGLLGTMMPMIEQTLNTTGFLPTDILQSFFAALDPLLGLRKFSKFAKSPEDGSYAKLFVALEDWLNDGVPLSGPAARECLQGWYLENVTQLGKWQIGGQTIVPETITLPVQCLIPQGDRIVPPSSASALAEKLPNAEAVSLQAGHIGMMAGGSASRVTWPLIRDFLDPTEG